MKTHTSQTSLPKEKVLRLYRTALQSGIPLDTVHQKVAHLEERESQAEKVEKEERARRQQALPLSKKIFFTLAPLCCVIIGFSLVSLAIWPLFSYYVFPSDDLQRPSLLAPIPNEQVLDVMPHILVQAQETEVGSKEFNAQNGKYVAPTILDDELDYTNLSNWFPNLALPNVDEAKTQEYTIDIPTLKIANAKVQVGGASLDKNLIQYPGTALPGDLGDPVIFGHSILRQFYNPSEKNPNRYLSLFSTIMTLKPGDKIYVTHQNVKYTYQVMEKRVVDPEDPYILQQQFENRQLKLITCVPEGTVQDRGVVVAQLVKGE